MVATRAATPDSTMRRRSALAASSVTIAPLTLCFFFYFGPGPDPRGARVTKKSGSRGAHSQKPLGSHPTVMRVHTERPYRPAEYSDLARPCKGAQRRIWLTVR